MVNKKIKHLELTKQSMQIIKYYMCIKINETYQQVFIHFFTTAAFPNSDNKCDSHGLA